jgi:CMP-N-acetylneuraminic acid synthetase
MKNNLKIVALVPLRGGSKSIPLKNIKPIAGKPLCLWVLEAAERSKMIEEVYVSTDSDKIKQVVNDSIKTVRVLDRDPILATDTASTESVIFDFMDKVDFDILATIQATSPLTSSEDLDSAIKQFMDNNLDSLLTGVRIRHFVWSDEGKPLNYDPQRRPMRQQFSGSLLENGAFYLTKREILEKQKCRLGGKIGLYEMQEEAGYETDEPADWEIIGDILLKNNRVK